MPRARRHWLMKCEPAAYTIDDLARDGVTGWEGVRNYQARNFLRDDMQPGDRVIFYASNADPSGAVGLAEIASSGYPDPFARDAKHRYHDPKSTAEDPIWFTVDVRFVERFAGVLSLDDLRSQPGLEGMMVLRKGSRLSIQPVTADEYEIVAKMGRATGRSAPVAPTTGAEKSSSTKGASSARGGASSEGEAVKHRSASESSMAEKKKKKDESGKQPTNRATGVAKKASAKRPRSVGARAADEPRRPPARRAR